MTVTVQADVGYALDKRTVTNASGKTMDVEKVNNTTPPTPYKTPYAQKGRGPQGLSLFVQVDDLGLCGTVSFAMAQR